MTQETEIRVALDGGDSLVEMIQGKLHGLQVTESKLNYHGSITIDTAIIEAAHMMPLEFVYIWNKATGARISTYILPGERGSGIVCLNGAAARTCQVGDEVIVTSSRQVPVRELACEEGFAMSPRVVMFDHSARPNAISEILEYRARIEKGIMHFDMVPVAGEAKLEYC